MARECCDHACAQGRDCPLRTDRRAGPSLLWTVVSWLVPDRRKNTKPDPLQRKR